MAWEFTSERPIYLQIVDRIQTDIVTGKYYSGQRVPPVRQLAAVAAVNPNTMQRAYAELERTGLVSALRTSGRFVTEDPEVIAKSKLSMANELKKDFLSKISVLGYSAKEAAELLLND